jgi:hypothetical protein
VSDPSNGSEFAGECLGFTGDRGLELTRHAAEKLETYGIEGERLASWRAALTSGESFVDVTTGACGLVIDWEGRPWIVILREDESAVVTTYPSDVRTVNNRRGGGRWISPSI